MQASQSFWSCQLKTAWRNMGSLPAPPRAHAFVHLARQLASRHQSASGSPLVGTAVPEEDTLTVIVLNHKRPQNVRGADRAVRAARRLRGPHDHLEQQPGIDYSGSHPLQRMPVAQHLIRKTGALGRKHVDWHIGI